MQKYVKFTVGLTALILVLVMVTMIVFDPLFQYHLPGLGFETVVVDDEEYYVPGMAKNFEYTNAIIGTSLSENFRASWFNEIYSGKTLKLTINGSEPVEYRNVIDLVLEHEGTENVIMDIAYSYLENDFNDSRLDGQTGYLFDDDKLNDVNYLLNKSIILTYLTAMIKGRNNGTDMDILFSWDSKRSHNEQTADRIVSYIKKSDVASEHDAAANLQDNMARNIQYLDDCFAGHPDVHFTVFVPPYSIAYWYRQLRLDKLDDYEAQLPALLALSRYDNVDVYFFTSDDWLMTMADFDNYVDPLHYGLSVSQKISDCIVSKDCLVTADNAKEYCDRFFSFIKEYDYSQYLDN